MITRLLRKFIPTKLQPIKVDAHMRYRCHVSPSSGRGRDKRGRRRSAATPMGDVGRKMCATYDNNDNQTTTTTTTTTTATNTNTTTTNNNIIDNL